MVLISFTAGLEIGQTWGERYGGGDLDVVNPERGGGLRDPREIIGASMSFSSYSLGLERKEGLEGKKGKKG